MANTTKVMPNWAKFEPVTAKPSPEVPVSRTRFDDRETVGDRSAALAPNSDPTPQARAAPQAGTEAGTMATKSEASGTAAAGGDLRCHAALPGLTRCSKCSGRVRWVDAYRSLRCSWCEVPLAASQVREVWGEVSVDQGLIHDPDDLWGEPTSAEPSARLWTRLDVPKDVVGGLGLVVGVGAKWDGVWWCEVRDGVEVHHRLGDLAEFLYDRPK